MENIYEKLHSLYFSPNNVTVIGSTWIEYTRQMTALKKIHTQLDTNLWKRGKRPRTKWGTKTKEARLFGGFFYNGIVSRLHSTDD